MCRGEVRMDSAAETLVEIVDAEAAALEVWCVQIGDRAWTVEAENWLSALGWAVQRSGELPQLRRLAIDVRPDGRVVVLDVKGGTRASLQRR